MDIGVIFKILEQTFPDEIVREVASYFILRIPKTDRRFWRINSFLFHRKFSVHERFYNDGEFLSKSYYSSNWNHPISFHVKSCPGLLLEYISVNHARKTQTNMRFWIEDGRCEESIDGVWVAKNY